MVISLETMARKAMTPGCRCSTFCKEPTQVLEAAWAKTGLGASLIRLESSTATPQTPRVWRVGLEPAARPSPGSLLETQVSTPPPGQPTQNLQAMRSSRDHSRQQGMKTSSTQPSGSQLGCTSWQLRGFRRIVPEPHCRHANYESLGRGVPR